MHGGAVAEVEVGAVDQHEADDVAVLHPESIECRRPPAHGVGVFAPAGLEVGILEAKRRLVRALLGRDLERLAHRGRPERPWLLRCGAGPLRRSLHLNLPGRFSPASASEDTGPEGPAGSVTGEDSLQAASSASTRENGGYVNSAEIPPIRPGIDPASPAGRLRRRPTTRKLVTMGPVGPLSKRAVAGIALAFGALTLVIVILASGGGNDDDGGARIEKAQKDAAEQFRKGAAGGQGAEGVTGAEGPLPRAPAAIPEPGAPGGDTGSDGSGGGSPNGSPGGSGQPGAGGGSGNSPASQGGQGTPEEPYVELALRDNKRVGGFRRLVVKRDDRVRVRVSADVDDIVRVDGYNLSQTVSPSSRAAFDFPAKLNGIFEIGLQKRGIPLAYLIVRGDVARPGD